MKITKKQQYLQHLKNLENQTLEIGYEITETIVRHHTRKISVADVIGILEDKFPDENVSDDEFYHTLESAFQQHLEQEIEYAELVGEIPHKHTKLFHSINEQKTYTLDSDKTFIHNLPAHSSRVNVIMLDPVEYEAINVFRCFIPKQL